MKRWTVVALVALAAVAFVTNGLSAQEPTEGGNRPGPGGDHRGPRPGMGDPLTVLKELNLTADQEAQVKQIMDTHRQAVANWENEHGEEAKALEKKIREAREAKDGEAMRAAGEELRNLMATRRELQDGLTNSIKGVLTEEQQAKAKELMSRGWSGGAVSPFAALRMLDLSEEQRAKVKEIMQAAEQEAKAADDPAKKKEIFDAAFKKIRETVLTEEQNKRLDEILSRSGDRGGRPDLNLTEEQRAQIKTILDEAKKAAAEADSPEAKQKIMSEAKQKIHDTVLTEEQKKKIEERGGREGPPPPPGGAV